MRLGGPLFCSQDTPEAWVDGHRQCGYRAAFLPLPPGTPDAAVASYRDAAAKADLIIAEVGAWSNPLSPVDDARKQAIDHCIGSLALADLAGARCCVNIAGSRGEKWDGPSALDLTPETFDMIVETVRHIIDSVKPTRSAYALETMPWMYPDSAGNYLDLIKAIDRPGMAVHLDPVNLVNCPQRYFANGALIRECFAKLGPHIRSCHAKDIILRDHLTVHLDECRPGTGGLDYGTFLREAARLDADLPIMLEHLPDAQEYELAAGHLRAAASQEGLPL